METNNEQLEKIKAGLNTKKTFEQIKNIAQNRDTKTLKEDVKTAYGNMKAKCNDATKIVYHAINEVLIERLGEKELGAFEKTYR